MLTRRALFQSIAACCVGPLVFRAQVINDPFAEAHYDENRLPDDGQVLQRELDDAYRDDRWFDLSDRLLVIRTPVRLRGKFDIEHCDFRFEYPGCFIETDEASTMSEFSYNTLSYVTPAPAGHAMFYGRGRYVRVTKNNVDMRIKMGVA